MDADDRVDADNHEKLEKLFAQLTGRPGRKGKAGPGNGLAGSAANDNAPNAAFSYVASGSLPSPVKSAGAFVMTCRCLPNQDNGFATDVQHVRVFRNDPRLRWEHRIHEQILPALRRNGVHVEWG
jgi:hypothetical protein